MYSVLIGDLGVLQQQAENAYQEIPVKPGILTEFAPLCDKEVIVVLEMHGNYGEHLH